VGSFGKRCSAPGVVIARARGDEERDKDTRERKPMHHKALRGDSSAGLFSLDVSRFFEVPGQFPKDARWLCCLRHP
jgi:hypothetical protein